MEINTGYRAQIIQELFGPVGRDFESYVKVYDNLVYDNLIACTELHVLQIEEPGPGDSALISHVDILTAMRIFRQNSQLMLNEAIQLFQARLHRVYSSSQAKFAIFVAVRAMLILNYTISNRPREIGNHIGVLVTLY